MNQLVVGGDVSQKQIDIAIWTGEQAEFVDGFDNSAAGLTQLEKTIETLQCQQQASSVLFVIEPTGGYEQLVARFALKAGWQVAMPNPKQVRTWAKGAGTRAKTDRVDSKLLARYGAVMQPPSWSPPEACVEALGHLLSRLQDLQKMLQAEQNRAHALNQQPIQSPVVSTDIAESIAFFEQKIEAMNQAIRAYFDNHPQLKQQNEQLQSVPGVGKKNAPILLTFLHQFAALTENQGSAKSLTAYAGLDPVPYESGTSVNKPSGISRQGNKPLRRYLYLGALGGSRGKNPLRAFYQRLVSRGKAKKLALCACARKILVWSWAVFRQGVAFDPTRFEPSLQTPSV